jgi:carboxyl-terminal processing protease
MRIRLFGTFLRRRPAALLAGAILVLGMAVHAQPPARPPLPVAAVMQVVGEMLPEAHISERPLDDEVSREAFARLFKTLDPLRLYFEAADLEAFAKHRDSIDDFVKSGDPSFAYAVQDVYLRRVSERTALVEELLKEPVDFTIDESMTTDRNALLPARDADEIRDRWRRRLKLDLLGLIHEKVEGQEARDRLLRRYQRLRDRLRQETREEAASRLLNAVAAVYDPHTTYFAPKPYEDFSIGVTLNYAGVGALLGEEDDYIIVRTVFPGGAIAKQGTIKPKDRIVSIGQGEDGPLVDVVGMRLSDAVEMIRGPEGTVVRLGILPAGGGQVRIDRLVRQRIELEDSAAKGSLREHGSHPDGRPYRIGIIDLPGFYRDTEAADQRRPDFRSSTRDVARLLTELKSEGADAMILDLRRNGGGLLPEAVDVSGLFLDGGPVVQVKGKGSRIRRLDDPERSAAWDGPLVVLTSRASASGSEIVAKALQDHRRALIVGDETTHGKGTVQATIDLASATRHPGGPGALGVLKVTTQVFYGPLGASTQLHGVQADVPVPSWMSVLDGGEAELENALPFSEIPPARLVPGSWVDEGLVATLAKASRERLAASPRFQDLRRRMEIYREFQARKSITLNAAAYLALQKQLDEASTEAEDAMAPEGAAPPAGEAAPSRQDATLDEALAITIDYLRLLRTRKA